MSFVLGLLLGVFLGAGAVLAFNACRAIHKAVRNSLHDFKL